MLSCAKNAMCLASKVTDIISCTGKQLPWWVVEFLLCKYTHSVLFVLITEYTIRELFTDPKCVFICIYFNTKSHMHVLLSAGYNYLYYIIHYEHAVISFANCWWKKATVRHTHRVWSPVVFWKWNASYLPVVRGLVCSTAMPKYWTTLRCVQHSYAAAVFSSAKSSKILVVAPKKGCHCSLLVHFSTHFNTKKW